MTIERTPEDTARFHADMERIRHAQIFERAVADAKTAAESNARLLAAALELRDMVAALACEETPPAHVVMAARALLARIDGGAR